MYIAMTFKKMKLMNKFLLSPSMTELDKVIFSKMRNSKIACILHLNAVDMNKKILEN